MCSEEIDPLSHLNDMAYIIRDFLLYRYRVNTRQDMRFLHALVNIITLFCNRTDLRLRCLCAKTLRVNSKSSQ